MKGGKDNKITEIFVEAEVETTGTQAQLEELHKKIELSCPVYQIISGSGVKITSNWKNIEIKK